MGFIDEDPPFAIPAVTFGNGPPLVFTDAPSSEFRSLASGSIADAINRIGEGKNGFILLHEMSQDGREHQTNAVFVKRIGDNLKATLWVGRDWNKPGIVGVRGELIWVFD